MAQYLHGRGASTPLEDDDLSDIQRTIDETARDIQNATINARRINQENLKLQQENDLLRQTLEENTYRLGQYRMGEMTRARIVPAKPEPYLGKQSWTRWFSAFEEDMEFNGWDEKTKLHELKKALKGGPGEEALEKLERLTTKSYTALVALAETACKEHSQGTAYAKFKSRMQKKDEELRTFALELKRLAADVFTDIPLDTPWLRDQLSGRFIEGIRDPELQQVVRSEWKQESDIDSLCSTGDFHY